VSPSLAALLIGLFIVPLVLLWMGQRLRRRTAAWRGMFWGAVIGHALGMLATVGAMHLPPVLWSGSDARTAAVHWAMLLGAVLGAAMGWMMGRAKGARAE
jgi:hypothetical protein